VTLTIKLNTGRFELAGVEHIPVDALAIRGSVANTYNDTKDNLP
jgi:hypothetical protein